MDLTDVHPFRWVRERPALGMLVRTGGHRLDLQVLTDFVDLQEGVVGKDLDHDLHLRIPSPNPLSADESRAYMANERVALLATHRFFAGGRRTITCTSELLHDLECTDLDDVRPEDIHFPFDTFHIAFGNDSGLLLFGGSALIDGVTFHLRRDGDALKGIELLLTTSLMARRAERGKRIRAPHHASPVLGLSLVPGGTLTAMFDEELDLQASAVAQGAGTVVRVALDALANHRGMVRAALALAFNLLAYMTAEPDDVAQVWTDDAPLPPGTSVDAVRSLPRGVAHKLETEGFTVVHLVGRVAAIGRKARLRAGPTFSTQRRGHWRRQPVGPGRRAIRLIWILPTWVRPDLPMSEANVLYVQH